MQTGLGFAVVASAEMMAISVAGIVDNWLDSTTDKVADNSAP